MTQNCVICRTRGLAGNPRQELAEQLLKPRGRPRSPDAKVSISLRIPPEVLARWKASGPGWQTRIVATLSRAAPRKQADTGKDR
jgi:uncharacterized protein (DUF4415 family)